MDVTIAVPFPVRFPKPVDALPDLPRAASDAVGSFRFSWHQFPRKDGERTPDATPPNASIITWMKSIGPTATATGSEFRTSTPFPREVDSVFRL
jgi:hypothetical protein